jgi:hypothetical protein
MTASPKDRVTIHLDQAEALVIFEALSRWSEQKDAKPKFEHRAEYHALCDRLLPELERQLVASFRDDFAALLESARAEIIAGYSDD